MVGNCGPDGFLERSCSVCRNLMLELELFMVLNVCNSSTRGREVRRTEVQGHPQLYKGFEASLDLRAPYKQNGFGGGKRKNMLDVAST